MKNIASIPPIDSLLADYQTHLLNNAGIAPSTCKRRAFYARSFLTAQFKPKASSLDFQRITAKALLSFVLEQTQTLSMNTMHTAASCLRCFCRFLCVRGHLPNDVSQAIPRIGSHGRDQFPTYLSRQEVQRLLDSFSGHTPSDLRNYAAVLCLAKLGLRIGELARLALDDIDWRAGTVRLAQTKSRRDRQLPLPAQVGRALVRYLRKARPDTRSRQVFVCLQDGKPLHPESLASMTKRAMARVGITAPRKGPHLLRKTLASHLVQRGITLKAVADLLGHTHLNTTQIYAKVDLPLLKQVAMPWPKEVRR